MCAFGVIMQGVAGYGKHTKLQTTKFRDQRSDLVGFGYYTCNYFHPGDIGDVI
jgi:hypothetical protein